jgi:hypothetical protein
MYIHYLFSIENMQDIIDGINERGEDIVASFSISSAEGQAVIICKAKVDTIEQFARVTPTDKLRKILGRPVGQSAIRG